MFQTHAFGRELSDRTVEIRDLPAEDGIGRNRRLSRGRCKPDDNPPAPQHEREFILGDKGETQDALVEPPRSARNR